MLAVQQIDSLSTSCERSGRRWRWFSREFFLALSGRSARTGEMGVSSTTGACCSVVSAMLSKMVELRVTGGGGYGVGWAEGCGDG